MATLFYLVSAVLMPVRELVLTAQGRSSWARWRLVCRHFAFALAMVGTVVATFVFLPRAVLPPDVTIGGVSSLLVTVLLFVAYLVVANLAALLVPRSVQLPEPKLATLPGPQEPAAFDVDLTGVDLTDVELIDVDVAVVDLTDVELADVESAA